MNKNLINILKTFYKGILAGSAIGLGGTFYLLCSTYIPQNDYITSSFIGSLVFPVGLIIICFCGLNLYTGKIGVAFNKDTKTSDLNVYFWLFIILLGNFIGATLVGLILHFCIFNFPSSSIYITANAVSNIRVMEFNFTQIFNMCWKSFVCGILVYLAVLFFKLGRNSFEKVLGIIAPIAFFVISGMQHCIANMFYLTVTFSWNLNSTIGLFICILFNSLGALAFNFITESLNKKKAEKIK